MPLIQTTALGLPNRIGSGNQQGVPSGIADELLASQCLPRYSALTKQGRVFTARAALNQLSLPSTGLAGLILWNNASLGNSFDLYLLKVSGNVAVSSSTMTGIALAYGLGQPSAPTSMTLAPTTSDYIGSPIGGYGIAYLGGVFVNAPVAAFDLLHNTAAIGTAGEDAGFDWDLEGSVVIPPQSYVCFVALGAASAGSAVNLSLKWTGLAA